MILLMWGILLGILTFVILVILHELGHFTAAKKSGVKVKEFGFGIPPKAKTLWKDKAGTEYTLNWIPLGGFVVLKGEDGTNSEENQDADSFLKAKLRKKLIIIIGGVTMNFITAWVLFTIAFSIGMQPMSVLPDGYMGIYSQSYVTPSVSFLEKQGFLNREYTEENVVIKEVVENSEAERLGLKNGATILSINNENTTPKDLPTQLTNAKASENSISYILPGDNRIYTGTFSCGEECVLGVIYDSYKIPTIKFSFPRAMLESLKEIKAEWNLTMDNLKRMGSLIGAGESKQALNSLSGPVAIVKVGQVLFDNFGLLSFIGFAGLISVALAIMNILPIPALDGGKFWALIIQKVFHLKEEKFFTITAWVDTVFFRGLMLIGIIIILKDLSFRGINIPFLT